MGGHYSGAQIMKIFMTILLKSGMDVHDIRLYDASRKDCAKTGTFVQQSIFMGFLDRFDFYREYGFVPDIVKGIVNRKYAIDVVKQCEYDEAKNELYATTVGQVITATTNVENAKALHHELVEARKAAENEGGNEFDSKSFGDYLRKYTVNWNEDCDKYLALIADWYQVDILREKLNALKPRNIELIYDPTMSEAMNARLDKTACPETSADRRRLEQLEKEQTYLAMAQNSFQPSTICYSSLIVIATSVALFVGSIFILIN